MELLTVVAVMSILAAIMFPAFKSAKENARKTGCISNLHTIAVALQQYRLDNNRYPVCLLGYYDANDPHMTSCTSGLYPEYVRSITDFTCPSMGNGSELNKLATATVPASARAAKELQYYYGDSYDWTDSSGSGKAPMATYLTTWANVQDDVTTCTVSDPQDDADKQLRDFGRQLRFKNPDSTTVVTWCMNHNRNSTMVQVLFLSGNVVPIPLDKMEPDPPTTGRPTTNTRWRALP